MEDISLLLNYALNVYVMCCILKLYTYIFINIWSHILQYDITYFIAKKEKYFFLIYTL